MKTVPCKCYHFNHQATTVFNFYRSWKTWQLGFQQFRFLWLSLLGRFPLISYFQGRELHSGDTDSSKNLTKNLTHSVYSKTNQTNKIYTPVKHYILYKLFHGMQPICLMALIFFAEILLLWLASLSVKSIQMSVSQFLNGHI